jgi:hypothetical protein
MCGTAQKESAYFLYCPVVEWLTRLTLDQDIAGSSPAGAIGVKLFLNRTARIMFNG